MNKPLTDEEQNALVSGFLNYGVDRYTEADEVEDAAQNKEGDQCKCSNSA